MNTEMIRADDPQVLVRALQILRGGGLVAFPTDTVYGLGALASNEDAVKSIYVAKDRSPDKAIPILIASEDELIKVVRHVSPLAKKLAAGFWPGPLTLVLPKRGDLPASISASDTVGVRVPAHSAARALLRAAGPLAVTSANISGQESPRTAQEVLHQLGGRIPLILDGGETPGGVPSTLVDCVGAEPIILREGPVSFEQIQAAIFSS